MFPDRLQRFGFTLLAEVPGRELVFGLAGKFWRPDGGLRRLANATEFLEFCEIGCVKAAWNLRIVDLDATRCVLSTETRLKAFGPSARRKFRWYWRVIAPFSGAIRTALLRSVRQRGQASYV